MAVTYLIKFAVVPDQRDRFLALLNRAFDAIRSEPMFHQAFLHEDPEVANRFMLSETWKSNEDVVEVQLKLSYREAWHEAPPELLSKPHDVTVWESLRANIPRSLSGKPHLKIQPDPSWWPLSPNTIGSRGSYKLLSRHS